MDPVVAALGEVYVAMLGLLRGLQVEDWKRPTPCSEWDVRQLVSHVASATSLFEGLPQPPVPDGWSTHHQGIHALAADLVARRQNWAPEEILDELEQATNTQVERFQNLEGKGWRQDLTMPAPPGVKTQRELAYNRLLDGYIHLLDLRDALGRPLDLDAESTALAQCVSQAIEFTGWGAVKKATLPDGSRVRLELSDPHGYVGDLVVENRRGSLVHPDPETAESVVGTAPAYLFVAAGRPLWTDRAGGIRAEGRAATRLLEGYVIWA
ncbi:MAG: maleylpyruvate isomerase family mycothiol-dependent enzyme [Actinomycetota bacterium]